MCVCVCVCACEHSQRTARFLRSPECEFFPLLLEGLFQPRYQAFSYPCDGGAKRPKWYKDCFNDLIHFTRPYYTYLLTPLCRLTREYFVSAA